MSFKILPEAERDELRAASWYDRHNPGKGDDFLDAVAGCYRAIQQMPSVFPRIVPPRLKGDFRFNAIKRFEYTIFFQVKNGDIIIISISHHRRRPFYWVRRLKRR